jgi:hypothetical protein
LSRPGQGFGIGFGVVNADDIGVVDINGVTADDANTVLGADVPRQGSTPHEIVGEVKATRTPCRCREGEEAGLWGWQRGDVEHGCGGADLEALWFESAGTETE